MSSTRPQFNYGGQAVIEGVMMRGAHIAAIAVRAPDGEIVVHTEPLNKTLYRGWVSRLPFVRGLIGLWDALGLGTKALMWSANIAAIEEEEAEKSGTVQPIMPSDASSSSVSNVRTYDKSGADEIFSGGVAAGMIAVSLSLGIGLFFVTPAVASSGISKFLDIDSRLVTDSIEGAVKLALFIGYLFLIGQMNDVKRLFGYHGAEHKTINAYEAGGVLVPEEVKLHSIEHPRCGTAFLLTVVMLSILVHALTGRPSNFFLLVLTRIIAIPLIAALAYEILRFTAKHAENPFIRVLIIPNLALQHLTTREPDTSMIEVAIEAFKRVVAMEEIKSPVVSELDEDILVGNTPAIAFSTEK